MLSVNQYFQYIKENIIFSSKNIEYNLNDWIDSKNKKLLITGYTGSGKSTLSKTISKKYNVKLIELDKYIKINEQYVNKLKNQNKINKYYQDTIDLHISKLLKSNEKLIIEGIQLFIYSDVKDFKNYSIIIIGTSALKSAIQAFNRNKNDDHFKEWDKLEIIKDIYYNLFIPKVEKFIKLIESWNK